MNEERVDQYLNEQDRLHEEYIIGLEEVNKYLLEAVKRARKEFEGWDWGEEGQKELDDLVMCMDDAIFIANSFIDNDEEEVYPF